VLLYTKTPKEIFICSVFNLICIILVILLYQVSVLCVVTPYSVRVGYQSFGVPCCLHLHRRGNLESRIALLNPSVKLP
jgi:hypothetical protein